MARLPARRMPVRKQASAREKVPARGAERRLQRRTWHWEESPYWFPRLLHPKGTVGCPQVGALIALLNDRDSRGRDRDRRRNAARLRRECVYFRPRRFRLSGRTREFTRPRGSARVNYNFGFRSAW